MFLLMQTFKTIRKHLGINLVILLTLFVAYLFFFMVCCYVEDGLLGLSSFSLKEKERSVYFYGWSAFGQRNDALSQKDLADFAARNSVIEDMTAVEDDSYFDSFSGQSLTLYRVDGRFQSHFTFPILQGRYFTEEELSSGAPVCVIGEGLWLRKNRTVGDDLNVGNIALKIIGVMKYNANMSANLVPRQTLEGIPVPGLDIQGYYFAATLSDPSRASEIRWSELGLTGEPLSGDDYFRRGLTSLLGRGAMYFFVGILVLFYALMNFVNIFVGKMREQQKSLGIRIALGASHGKVFAQFFLEVLILALMAVLCVFCLDPLIADSVRRIINHAFGPVTFCTVLAVSVLSSFLLSCILFRKFRRVEITRVLKES